MADNKQNDKGTPNTQQQPERASPETIGKTSVEIANILARFTPVEQWRIIKAASTINGIEPTNAQRQGQQQRRG